MAAPKRFLNPEFRLLASFALFVATILAFVLLLHREGSALATLLLDMSKGVAITLLLLTANVRNARRDDSPGEFERLMNYGLLLSLPAPVLAAQFLFDTRAVLAVGMADASIALTAATLAVLSVGAMANALLVAVLGTLLFTLVFNGTRRNKVLAAMATDTPRGAGLLAPATRTLYEEHDFQASTKLD